MHPISEEEHKEKGKGSIYKKKKQMRCTKEKRNIKGGEVTEVSSSRSLFHVQEQRLRQLPLIHVEFIWSIPFSFPFCTTCAEHTTVVCSPTA
jgi:hypothetical protein